MDRDANRGNVATTDEVASYFQRRTERLEIVHTTRTPSGQLLDWIPIESQRLGGELASPPPPGPAQPQASASASRELPAGVSGQARPVTFELEDPAAERGPEGTVPVVRKQFTDGATTSSLREYLAKYPKRAARADASVGADPNPVGFFHATSGETITCFGAQTVLNVWAPALQNANDHSIMQLGLQNYDLPQLQSLEAGWEVSNEQYGDGGAHLFIYYTTNGYTKDDDNVGGYNQDVDGWVQVDNTIYPAARLSPASTRGGGQQVITIKYQLFNANWWFQVQGKWIGYYPASLFMGNQSVFSTIGDHASWAGFWGEVYTSDADQNATTTQMGSGAFAEAGFDQACYQSNVQVQTDRAGAMADHNGSPSAENSAYYDIVATMNSGTSWGSYFYAGGPGSLVPWASIGGIFPPAARLAAVSRNANQLDVFVCGNDGVVYTNWWNPGDPWPGANNAWMGIGGFFPPGAPVAAVSRNPDQLDLFVCGNDGVVYTNWWNPSNPWPGANNAWMGIGGFFPPGAPVSAVSRNANQLDLFVCGNDGVVYTNWWNPSDPWPGRANAWMAIGGFFPPGAPVAAVSRNPDQLDLFVCGNDGVVYTNWWNPSDPWPGRANAWMGIGGVFPPGARLAAVSRNPDQLDVFVCGNDGVVYTNWWNPSDPWPGANNAWTGIGGFFPPGAPVSAVSRNANQLDAFVCGNNGVVYTNWWNPSDPWPGRANAWMQIGGVFPAGAPVAAVTRNPDQLDVFVCGNDGVVYTNWWNPGAPWPGASGR